MSPEFWIKVICSDASKFTIFKLNDRFIVWWEPNAELDVEILCRTFKHEGSGAMAFGSQRSLIQVRQLIQDIMDQKRKETNEKEIEMVTRLLNECRLLWVFSDIVERTRSTVQSVNQRSTLRNKLGQKRSRRLRKTS